MRICIALNLFRAATIRLVQLRSPRDKELGFLSSAVYKMAHDAKIYGHFVLLVVAVLGYYPQQF